MTQNNKTNKHESHPLFEEQEKSVNQSNMGAFEVITQAFNLLFALQKGKGMKRAADLLETNPKSVLLAGFLSIVIFLGICLSISQAFIYYYS